jgi:hypothetical protein
LCVSARCRQYKAAATNAGAIVSLAGHRENELPARGVQSRPNGADRHAEYFGRGFVRQPQDVFVAVFRGL